MWFVNTHNPPGSVVPHGRLTAPSWSWGWHAACGPSYKRWYTWVKWNEAIWQRALWEHHALPHMGQMLVSKEERENTYASEQSSETDVHATRPIHGGVREQPILTAQGIRTSYRRQAWCLALGAGTRKFPSTLGLVSWGCCGHHIHLLEEFPQQDMWFLFVRLCLDTAPEPGLSTGATWRGNLPPPARRWRGVWYAEIRGFYSSTSIQTFTLLLPKIKHWER